MTRRYWIGQQWAGPLEAALDALDAEGRGAVEDGRVFVNRRRASRHTRVAPGDLLEVQPTRDGETEPVRVLAERAGALLVWKPAGLPTEPDRRGNRSLVTEVALLCGRSLGSVHAVTRLDLEVSGVAAVALDRDARRTLTAAQAAGRLGKSYLGLAATAPKQSQGRWDSPIGGRGPQPQGARRAVTSFRSLAQTGCPVAPDRGGRAGLPTLLGLYPETGRTHQIRIHCARADAPLVGDRRYGGPRRLALDDGRVVGATRVALHAHRLESDDLCATAPEPVDLVRLWRQLGGEAETFTRALERI